ncbi:MAG: Leucine--tRNA ligase [Methanoregulaceae archaeon PtaU1.Bin222]|nr:MAG: Leucine--tRNA ligase [Methanoregulaceae archaeon PtaU1.Bin222]
MRKEFEYWYPYDYRFSAKDLISNHLTFQLFHHAAIFPKESMPRGMVVFGMGLLEGAKMSSSKGNVFLLEDALKEFGADTVRMFLVGSAEPWQDFDWRNDLVYSTRKQIERFWNTIEETRNAEHRTSGVDPWLISRLQQHIQKATEALERFQTRQALQEAFYAIEADLKWYRRRLPDGAPGGYALKELGSIWVRLLAPVIPFTCERLWSEIGGEGLVSFAPWPSADRSRIDPNLELAEELLLRTIEDIESIRKVIQITPSSITICVAPSWKKDVFASVATAPDRNTVIREIMKDEQVRRRGKAAQDAIKQCITLIHRLPPGIVEQYLKAEMNEIEIFDNARDFLERECSAKVHVVDAGESTLAKASAALPFKPAIVLE